MYQITQQGLHRSMRLLFLNEVSVCSHPGHRIRIHRRDCDSAYCVPNNRQMLPAVVSHEKSVFVPHCMWGWQDRVNSSHSNGVTVLRIPYWTLISAIEWLIERLNWLCWLYAKVSYKTGCTYHRPLSWKLGSITYEHWRLSRQVKMAWIMVHGVTTGQSQRN